jgi:hypothetical protein
LVTRSGSRKARQQPLKERLLQTPSDATLTPLSRGKPRRVRRMKVRLLPEHGTSGKVRFVPKRDIPISPQKPHFGPVGSAKLSGSVDSDS